MAEVEANKRQRSGRRSGSVQGNGQKPAVNVGNLNSADKARKVSRQEALDALVEVFERDPGTPYSQAGRVVGRSKSWVAGAVADLEQAGRLRRNGEGVEVLEGGGV